jgi:hypothetical protein
MTGKREVIDSSVRLVPTNALVLIEFGGEFYWMVGNPEINADTALSE